MDYNDMPQLDEQAIRTALNASDLHVTMDEFCAALECISRRGKYKGCLRASKPSETAFEGRAAYIWRQVAFNISPRSQHQCMPVTDIFYLTAPEYRAADMAGQRAYEKRLDAIADIIINTVPKDQWHGVRRWGKALGAL